jgi:hypothetical protein
MILGLSNMSDRQEWAVKSLNTYLSWKPKLRSAADSSWPSIEPDRSLS